MRNPNVTIGNRTRDLPACSAVTQPTAQSLAPEFPRKITFKNNQRGGYYVFLNNPGLLFRYKRTKNRMLTCVETSTWCSVEAEAAPLGPRFPVDPPRDPATGRETVVSLIARQRATSQSKYTLRFW
jgi:hypothetical protein